jgi:hypothetical protein
MADRNEKLELLVLLFVHGSKEPPTLSEAGGALKTLLAHLGAAEAKTALESAFESCVSTGTAEAEGKRTLRFRLTPEGQRRLEAEFGTLPKASWTELRDRLLVPRCVSRPGQSVIAELKSFPALRNALALEAVGLEYRPRITPAAALNRIAAKASGAARSDAPAIRTAVVRNWLVRPARPTSTQPEADPSASFSLEEFVHDVRSAMTHATAGRWDGAKDFVNQVWRQLVAEGNGGELDLDSFKAHLLEANRRGLLRLSRADLVSAMPPEDVRESEIPSFGDVFHFVQP